jgi:hypothetical protein
VPELNPEGPVGSEDSAGEGGLTVLVDPRSGGADCIVGVAGSMTGEPVVESGTTPVLRGEIVCVICGPALSGASRTAPAVGLVGCRGNAARATGLVTTGKRELLAASVTPALRRIVDA